MTCPTSLVIEEIKTKMRYLLTRIKQQNLFYVAMSSVGEDVEKQELSYFLGRSINRSKHFLEQSDAV